MTNNKCVYLHKDKEGIIRYVGSGSTNRANLTCAKSGRGKKYKDFVNENGKLEVEIIAKNLTKSEAENMERELYDQHIDFVLNINRPSSTKTIPFEKFHELLCYDETSKTCLRWKVDITRGNSSVQVKAGTEAGGLSSSGYYSVKVNGKRYGNHRIIAVLHGLDIDGKLIDHIDRNRENNRIENLRVVTSKENNQNVSLQTISSANTSGATGVCYIKNKFCYVVNWFENNKRKYKYFPVKKYDSHIQAFNAACQYRKTMESLYYNLN